LNIKNLKALQVQVQRRMKGILKDKYDNEEEINY